MLYYAHDETEPAFNLAAEEFLLKHADDDCFMLWRSRKAVVVGKNQNALSEINPEFVDRHGIPVVRRISGGGAVYHDLGNVNFTFIKVNGDGPDLDFAAYTRPILDYLNRLSVPARLDGRSDLTVNGLKISGNAQHVHKNRVLHHGTLLFDVDLEMLAAALLVDPGKYADKAVRSIRSRVTNIRGYLPPSVSVGQFMEDLTTHVLETFGGRRDVLTPADRAAINDLADTKYRRWEWNFGNSPGYRFRNAARTPGGTLEVHLEVRDGTIRSLRILGDCFGSAGIAEAEARLVGCRHQRDALRNRLEDVCPQQGLKDAAIDHLLDAMF